MKKLKAILEKEWLNFKGSERGVFLIYCLLVLLWSVFPLNSELGSGPMWWLFFSVIISGTFSNSVFVSERLNGTMEIMLTSGFSRDTVFFGKIAFVLMMTIISGALCSALSMVWLSLAGQEALSLKTARDAFFFCAGSLMNVTFGAWMSLRLQSPRIIPFMTLMLMAVIVAAFYALSSRLWVLGGILITSGWVFGMFARKEFHGEKVIQPIQL
jgi:ABC-type transport system involved in multi-copper enzyme maturation permease subunit